MYLPVYMDTSDNCNMLCFQLGITANGATIPTRSWNIKAIKKKKLSHFVLLLTSLLYCTLATRVISMQVTQYSCNFANLAPDGCTQYFFGSTTGTVQSYNFNDGAGEHLANQDQAICVRRERSNCRICWAVMAKTDFEVSGAQRERENTVARTSK